MTVMHPIGDDLLMGYTTGRLPPAWDLLVATAVSLDDDARARLAAFEAVGGALLSREVVAPLRGDSFETVMNRIRHAPPSETVPHHVKVPAGAHVLPGPLRAVAGGDVTDLKWSGLDRGARQVVLTGDEDGTARLFSVPPGQAMPEQGPRRPEALLCLSGAFVDGHERFARGDVEFAGENPAQRLMADAGGDCICLAVTDARFGFRDLLPRFAQRTPGL